MLLNILAILIIGIKDVINMYAFISAFIYSAIIGIGYIKISQTEFKYMDERVKKYTITNGWEVMK